MLLFVPGRVVGSPLVSVHYYIKNWEGINNGCYEKSKRNHA